MADESLARLLRPRRVAVIGSVSKPGRMGSRTVDHLRAARFDGDVQAVSSVADLDDGDLDVAVVAVPARAVGEVLAEVAPRTANAIVYSSGFGESGDGRLVPPAGLRLLGPNTVGTYWASSRAVLTFAQAFDDLTDCATGRGVAVVSQSGAFGARVVRAARHRGLVIDGFVATGNEDDYTAAEVLAGLPLLPDAPRVVLLYLENVASVAGLLEAVRFAVASGVEVVVLPGGTSSAGARAAASHTAAASPDSQVLEEGLRRDGAVVVRSDRELVDAAVALTANPPERGRRFAVVTGSGGAGVVAADLLERLDVDVAPLSAELAGRLAPKLPDYAAVANPLDVTAQVIADTDLLAELVGDLGGSGEVDGVLAIARDSQAADLHAATAAGIPAVVALLDGTDATVSPLVARGLPIVGDLEGATRAVAALARDAMASEGRRREPVECSPTRTLGPIDDVITSLEAIGDLGIRTAPWISVDPARAGDVAAALSAAGVAAPFVVKVNMAAHHHKAASGGIHLDLVDTAAVETVLGRMADGESWAVVAGQLRGAPELFAGARIDPSLGVVVAAGLGGGRMDVIDRVVSLPGDTSADWFARRILDHVFAGDDRWRSTCVQLADVALRLGDLVRSTGASLAECNPLIPFDGDLVALDARFLRSEIR